MSLLEEAENMDVESIFGDAAADVPTALAAALVATTERRAMRWLLLSGA